MRYMTLSWSISYCQENNNNMIDPLLECDFKKTTGFSSKIVQSPIQIVNHSPHYIVLSGTI